MASITPTGKIVYLCDDVLRDPASGKTHFLGIFDDVIPPPHMAYPFRLGTICVVEQLTGGAGQVPFHAEVVDGATQQVLRRAGPFSLRFATRQQMVTACIRVQNCVFPQAGMYFVELYVGNRFVDDRSLRLH